MVSMSLTFNFLPIDQIVSGEGSVESIVNLIGREDAERTVIITSRSVSRTSFFRKLEDALPGATVYSNISQHSPIEEIDYVVNQTGKKNVKFFVSVGGGSVIDSTKVIRSKVDPEIPQVAIPTTLSAAEFSHIAGFSEEGEKRGIKGKNLVPRYIFLDPEATLETPIELWRSTGIRSLDHAIEATLGGGFVDMRVLFSTLSVKLLFENLTGNKLENRRECQVASWYSYVDVYDSPMGYSHQIGKVIGARWKIPHGITSCITLPEMLRFYSSSPPEGLSKLAISITGEKSEKKAVENLARTVDDFIVGMSLKRRLSDYGIVEENIQFIAEKIGRKDEIFMEHLRNLL